MALLIILAWLLGCIVAFSTGHVIWGIVAVIVPPVGVLIGGYWIIVFALAVLLAVFA